MLKGKVLLGGVALNIEEKMELKVFGRLTKSIAIESEYFMGKGK